MARVPIEAIRRALDDLIVRRVANDSMSYEAVVPNNGRIGALMVDYPNRETGKRSVFNVEVKPAYRRLGIARRMYEAAEKDFGPLTPSEALRDDGFEFWRRYRPEAVADDMRMHRDKLMGLRVPNASTEGLPIIIDSVGARSAGGWIEGREGMPTDSRSSVGRKRLEALLRELGYLEEE